MSCAPQSKWRYNTLDSQRTDPGRNLTWTVPGERMKAGKEHRVPLSPQAVAVLGHARQLRSRKGCDLVFPGRSGDREFKDMALTNPLWAARVGERATASPRLRRDRSVREPFDPARGRGAVAARRG